MEIKPLLELNPADMRRLNAGYSSSTRYQVGKIETPQRTVISLERIDLATPYVKHWETPDDEIELLQKAVAAGFSLAAYQGDEMTAIAIAEPRHWNRTLWIWEFHVAPAHQRQGIGRRLMDSLAEKARQANLRILALETQNTNWPAISFYRAVGFELDGLDLSYYTNYDLTDFEVALFMKRKLE